MINTCLCKHESQDKMYGKQQRVWNYAGGKGGAYKNRYRCTVCGSLRDIYKKEER